MAIVFDEVQFPPSIAKGSSGGPEFSTDIVELSSGIERRNQNWAASRATYDVATGVKSQTDINTLIAFFRARNGRARGFRFKDWTDYVATAQTMGPGTAFKKTSTDVTVNSGAKTYTTAGAISFAALLPGDTVYITGFVNGANNGSHVVVSATATVLTVQEALTTEAAGASVTFLKLGPYQLQKTYSDAGNSYVRALQKPVSGTVVVYFAGVTQPTWWTVVTTTGIVTLVGGTANPADGAALTADCQFDVPCRFDTDRFTASIDDVGIVISGANSMLASWAKLPIVEIRLQ